MTPLKAAEGSPDIKSGVEINDDFTRLLDSKVEEANIKDKAEGGNLMTLEEKINEELKQKEEETREEVKAEGKEEERLNTLKKFIEMIKEGIITKEVIMEKFGYTEEEINNLL